MFLLLIGVLAVCGEVFSHTYHSGACPRVEPMLGFKMDQMLGKWYVIQKTSTASKCVTYNFIYSEEPGKYDLEQDSQHFMLKRWQHDYRYTGVLSVPDTEVPARMQVRFPLSVAGSASFIILDTDYSTYAVIFTCQKLAFAHRQSATILSRSKELDKMFVDEMRAKLASFGVDPFDQSIISQNDCPEHPGGSTDGMNININPKTFSSGNIVEALKKTGKAIANGFQYIVDAGKSLYNKAVDTKETVTEPPPVRTGYGSVDLDAEWLPGIE